MPGYTHLQRAQPITLGQHLLAWVGDARPRPRRGSAARAQARPSARSGQGRSPARRSRCRRRPVGCGTRSMPSPTAISRSTTSTRRRCSSCTSRGSARSSSSGRRPSSASSRLPEEAATGSSMMPQKLNPDVAELARGKAGTAIGRLTGLLATVKGLPLAYNRDLQEDKRAVFDARRDVREALAALDRAGRAASTSTGTGSPRPASDPLLLATDAAEALVAEGVPFRDAHEQVATSVRAGTFDPDATAAESAAARLGSVPRGDRGGAHAVRMRGAGRAPHVPPAPQLRNLLPGRLRERLSCHRRRVSVLAVGAEVRMRLRPVAAGNRDVELGVAPHAVLGDVEAGRLRLLARRGSPRSSSSRRAPPNDAVKVKRADGGEAERLDAELVERSPCRRARPRRWRGSSTAAARRRGRSRACPRRRTSRAPRPRRSGRRSRSARRRARRRRRSRRRRRRSRPPPTARRSRTRR